MNGARALETLVRLIAYKEGVSIDVKIERKQDYDRTRNDGNYPSVGE